MARAWMRAPRAALVFVLAAAVATLPRLSAQGAATGPSGSGTRSGGTDLVILTDVSASVLPYYKDVTDFLVGPLVKRYLRLGDTLHLLSFGTDTRLEMAKDIAGEKDVKAALGRIFLLYPLDGHSDLISALDRLTAYVGGLPSSRPKNIVIITDAVQDPPASSRWAGLDAPAAGAEIRRASEGLRALGWPVHIVKLPFGSDRGSPVASAGARPGPTAAVQTAPAQAPGQAAPSVQPLPAAPAAVPSPAPSPTGGAPEARGAAASPGGASAADAPSTASAAAGAAAAEAPKAPQTAAPGGGAGIDVAAEAASALDATVTEWSGAKDGEAARDLGEALGLPSVSFPGNLGRQTRNLSLPLVIENPGPSRLSGSLRGVAYKGRELLAAPLDFSVPPGSKITIRPRIRLPEDLLPGLLELPVVLVFPEETRLGPAEGLLALTLVESPLLGLLSSPAWVYALAIGLAFIVALVLLRLLGWLPKRAESPMRRAVRSATSPRPPAVKAPPVRAAPEPAVRASAQPQPRPVAAKPSEEAPRGVTAASLPTATPGGTEDRFEDYSPPVRKKGSIQVEFRVVEQNSHIGKRNVHEMHEGQWRSVGGHNSDFLIYLVPMPAAVGKLHFDGEDCVFVPLRKDLFPGLEGPVARCLDRDIPMVSPRGYPLRLRFLRWEEPASRINRLLRSIEVPGLGQTGE